MIQRKPLSRTRVALRLLSGAAIGLSGIAMLSMMPGVSPAVAEVPTPSIYPISWELSFQNATPKRIVVEIAGQNVPKAYWYITYNVSNNSGSEQTFLPVFEMLTNEAKIIRSDFNIPPAVFDAIKRRENNRLLESFPGITGSLRLGIDQARDGVAIWEEPTPRMGQFSVFVAGLSGETVNLKDDAGKSVNDSKGNPEILRKTLQLNYHIRGDEVFAGEDEVNVKERNWVMR